MSLPSVVLASFAGAYDLLGVGHRGWLVETLPECISDQGSTPARWGCNAARSRVAALVELPFDDGEGLGTMREPSGLHLISWEYLANEAVEISCSLVGRRVGLRL